MHKRLLLGALQIVLVLSLGAKLLYDRVTRPRVWVLTAVYDPELPIRGRYLSERLKIPSVGFTYSGKNVQNSWFENRNWAYLEIRDGQLIAKSDGPGPGMWIYLQKNPNGSVEAWSEEPVLVFIPDLADIPTLNPGQEMWVEVTIPKQGQPRPIRIGIKKDGVITPLSLN